MNSTIYVAFLCALLLSFATCADVVVVAVAVAVGIGAAAFDALCHPPVHTPTRAHIHVAYYFDSAHQFSVCCKSQRYASTSYVCTYHRAVRIYLSCPHFCSASPIYPNRSVILH